MSNLLLILSHIACLVMQALTSKRRSIWRSTGQGVQVKVTGDLSIYTAGRCHFICFLICLNPCFTSSVRGVWKGLGLDVDHVLDDVKLATFPFEVLHLYVCLGVLHCKVSS
jgi:hypothetical protein